MPTLVTRGVVLRYANYRDHDRMLTILSPQFGRLDALSRGCRRPKSALMPGSELFVHGEFVLYQAGDRLTLSSCALEDTFYPLRLEPYRLTCASYMTALTQAAAQPGEEAAALYALLLKGLYGLAYDAGSDALGLTAAFLLCFADAAGYRPRLHRCARCAKPLDTASGGIFDVEAGGLCCPEHAPAGAYKLSPAQVAWMERTLANGVSRDEKTGAGTLFDMLRRYVETRLDTPIKASRLLP